MELQEIIGRLRDKCPSIKSFGKAAEFSNIENAPPTNFPAVYVLPLRDVAQHDDVGFSAGMSIVHSFGICIAVKNLRDNTGSAAQAELMPLRKEIFRALFDFSSGDFPANLANIKFMDGNLIGFIHSAVWWQDNFSKSFIMNFHED